MVQRRFHLLACSLICALSCVDQENDAPPGYPGSADCVPTAEPLVDPSTFISCGLQAHCVPAAILAVYDASQVWRLGPCPADNTMRCVPDDIIRDGLRYVPPTCAAFGVLEGRCLSEQLPEVQKQRHILDPSSCARGELCSPCYHPITGRDTGACSITTCDPGPSSGQHGFADCFNGAGMCVPTGLVPEVHISKLGLMDCAASTLCVENRILHHGPFQACTVTGLIGYEGTCLNSALLSLGSTIGAFLSKADCQGADMCIPCRYPNGSPTNAPGCPGVPPVVAPVI